MVALEETIRVPLNVTEHGTIRINDSRVSLDSIVHHFKLGATAEQIAESFPSLRLADIYTAISYYLSHHEEIEEYLRQQDSEADNLQAQLESDAQYHKAVAELRSRIMVRWVAKPLILRVRIRAAANAAIAHRSRTTRLCSAAHESRTGSDASLTNLKCNDEIQGRDAKQ